MMVFKGASYETVHVINFFYEPHVRGKAALAFSHFKQDLSPETTSGTHK